MRIPQWVFDTNTGAALGATMDTLVLHAVALNGSKRLYGRGSAMVNPTTLQTLIKTVSFDGVSGPVTIDPATGDRAQSTATLLVNSWDYSHAQGKLVPIPAVWWYGNGTIEELPGWQWMGNVATPPNAICSAGDYFNTTQLSCVACSPGTAHNSNTGLCD